jgi:arginyl-tRNA synthetase
MHRRICHALHDVHLAARMPRAFLNTQVRKNMETDKTYIGEIEVVKPGFINIKLNEDAVAAYLNDSLVCCQLNLS